MWHHCTCYLARKHPRVSLPHLPQTSDVCECLSVSIRWPKWGIQTCQFRSGLDKIYFYFVVTNIALYLICAVTCPVLKKKKKENHVATDNQDAKWWLQLVLFIYRGVCIIGIDRRNSFVSTCDIAQQNTDTYRFCSHFLVIFIYDNYLCRLVISVLYL